MNIQVLGYGFVGKAHALALENGVNKVYVYDPAKGFNERHPSPDCVIVCVSTPQDRDGSCDVSNVVESIENSPNVPILIKSTISLEGWRYLNSKFRDKRITFSPEYLRAKHAFSDFKSQKHIYVGGGDTGFWSSLLSDSLAIKVLTRSADQLILAKYFRNSFLASKVAFFNQVDDLCVNAGVDPYEVIDLVTEDDRIGSSHSEVTLERGFGGHCFPKDTKALLKTAEEYGYDLSILREAVEYNDRLRIKND